MVDLRFLSQQQRRALQLSVIFLERRLQTTEALQWAIRSGEGEVEKRLAVEHVVERAELQNRQQEPWAEAWRLVLESWRYPTVDFQRAEYELELRRRANDRSERIMDAIVDFVRPRLEIQLARNASAKPRKTDDLVSGNLTSGPIVSPQKLRLDVEDDASFLLSLASKLDAAIRGGLHTALRVGWDSARSDWKVGQLYRVYFVPNKDGRPDDDAVDEFHGGVTPSVKLLHASVARLVELRHESARTYLDSWKRAGSPVHLRLWAALARDSSAVDADDVEAFLLQLNDQMFWNIHAFPEVSELRALRFGHLSAAARGRLGERIRRGPPRKQFFRGVPAERANEAALYWSARELRRIQVAGYDLPERDDAWLTDQITRFPELARMEAVDFDFSGSALRFGARNVRIGAFEEYTGSTLLAALERAFAATREGWDHDPAEEAYAWLTLPPNWARVLAAMEGRDANPSAYPLTWEKFGWVHSPQENANARAEAERVLSLLASLSPQVVRRAIDGLSYWLDRWSSVTIDLPQELLVVWERMFDPAIAATNEKNAQNTEEREPSNSVEEGGIDALNNPISRLVHVFFAAFDARDRAQPAFQEGGLLKQMRGRIESATGHAGIVATYLLLQQAPVFLSVDRNWTSQRLLNPLKGDTVDSRTLWSALAYRTQFTDVLKVVGDAMMARAADRRLKRSVRESLVFSVVVECLHALWRDREAAVPFAGVQQMLRAVDDEVRGHGAWAVLRFLKDVSGRNDNDAAAEDLADKAVGPFLQNVWPQERNLATPTVAGHFAELPAAAGGRFAETVERVERFLVPFDCWSMADYGLWGEAEGRPKLADIDSRRKAEAFLRLLDLTVGKNDGSVVPLDLSAALAQIAIVAPGAANSPAYRRLKTQAREIG